MHVLIIVNACVDYRLFMCTLQCMHVWIVLQQGPSCPPSTHFDFFGLGVAAEWFGMCPAWIDQCDSTSSIDTEVCVFVCVCVWSVHPSSLPLSSPSISLSLFLSLQELVSV